MVLKETQLIITSGNATSTNFVPNAPQGIPVGTQAVNYQLTTGNQTNPVYIPQPAPRQTTNGGGMGTPVGQANDFYVMLPHPFDNVVKTEVRYFFMENGINNVYPSSAASIAAGTPDGNDTFYIRSDFDINDDTAGYQHEIKIPAGYYDRNALAAVILNLVNQLDASLVSGDSTNPMTTPSQTASNPIYNYDATSGTVLPNQNFSACSIGSDGVFRLESPIGGPFSTTSPWAISFQDRTSLVFQTGTQYLLGFQDALDAPIVNFNFVAISYTTSIMVNAPFQSTIDIYNYILIQSQKLGSRVVSTTGVNAHCIIPMSGLNTQVASQTGQFSYDGGNFTLDANYFDFPRRLDVIDIRLADSSGALLDIGQNTVTLVIRIIQSVV
jgi:hypothetical protein